MPLTSLPENVGVSYELRERKGNISSNFEVSVSFHSGLRDLNWIERLTDGRIATFRNFAFCEEGQITVCIVLISLSVWAGIQANLHVAIVMDFTSSKFTVNCESNPAFFKQCAVQWLEGWSRESMVKVSQLANMSHCSVLFCWS